MNSAGVKGRIQHLIRKLLVQAYIVPDIGIKHVHILMDGGDHLLQLLPVKPFQIRAVKRNGTVKAIVIPRQQFDQG
ncbi:hypothetical protein D3C75_1322890 [compost metagenome]